MNVAMWRFLAAFAVLAAKRADGTSVGAASHTNHLQLKRASASHFFARQPQFRHRLRVCNAYPYATMLTVAIREQVLTKPPMAYRTCRELEPQLKTGDRIDFKFADARAGTFVVQSLPASDAVLMLVIYRNRADSSEVAFESHMFSNLVNAQIAVIDTYRGPAQSSLRIQDVKDATAARSEILQYDSVVALNPGAYEVVLQGADGGLRSKSELLVEGGDSSVVIRCGTEPAKGRIYPEELIVYPVRPERSARSAAHGPSHDLRLLLLGVAVVIASVQIG